MKASRTWRGNDWVTSCRPSLPAIRRFPKADNPGSDVLGPWTADQDCTPSPAVRLKRRNHISSVSEPISYIGAVLTHFVTPPQFFWLLRLTSRSDWNQGHAGVNQHLCTQPASGTYSSGDAGWCCWTSDLKETNFLMTVFSVFAGWVITPVDHAVTNDT